MPGGHATGFIAPETESRRFLDQPAIFIERFEGRRIAIAQVDAVLAHEVDPLAFRTIVIMAPGTLTWG